MKATSLRLVWIGVTVAVLLVALYYAFDPEQHPFPKCLFKQVTGWDCAGCGSQRMLHALLHGDIVKAWHYNAGVMVGMPIIGIMLVASVFRDKVPRLYSIVNSRPMIIIVCVGIFSWWILRNIFG